MTTKKRLRVFPGTRTVWSRGKRGRSICGGGQGPTQIKSEVLPDYKKFKTNN
jgi:hypothetical protein